jgi:pyruvate/2-oxoglutarate dehydrogenase complex dihydrolipoamide acyltransferase (E2) component
VASLPIVSPLAGSVVAVVVEAGVNVVRGAPIAVVEAMKMEHEVRSPSDGVVESLRCDVGDVVEAGSVLATLRPVAASAPAGDEPPKTQADALRADLLELRAREALLADATLSACAPHARTSPTSATPAASSNTARSRSRRSAVGASSTT